MLKSLRLVLLTSMANPWPKIALGLTMRTSSRTMDACSSVDRDENTIAAEYGPTYVLVFDMFVLSDEFDPEPKVSAAVLVLMKLH